MKTYISLIRGINVGGNTLIPMPELKKVYESLGFSNVRTYLQSGNVLFEAASADAVRIEKAIEKRFRHDVAVILREPKDFKRILDTNPFLHQRKEDPSRLYVAFLSEPQLKGLAVPAGETAEFIPGKQELFLFYPDGSGRSKFTNNLIEKQLKVRATTRNWNTVNALYSGSLR